MLQSRGTDTWWRRFLLRSCGESLARRSSSESVLGFLERFEFPLSISPVFRRRSLRILEIPVHMRRNQEFSSLWWLKRQGLKADVIVVKVSGPASGVVFSLF
ncbi:hypothetical protein HID58_033550 [Brassica napus]|uniref:Uncharacterized protein n=1 Tax=Brassica napus TaxID=3708 RepID=A0ABQ8BZP6_BRANA|nr:hypothetical protein HID58_033550 [Brassica napus]